MHWLYVGITRMIRGGALDNPSRFNQNMILSYLVKFIETKRLILALLLSTDISQAKHADKHPIPALYFQGWQPIDRITINC